MKFIGQERIIRELKILLPQIKHDDLKMNFLLRGVSGYGKTLLGLRMCSYLSGSRYQYMFADNVIAPYKDVLSIFIDEIHLLENPEFIYQWLDKKETTFIFATNEYSDLKEPLVNRCTVYTFEDYTDNELLEIAGMYMNNSQFTKDMLWLVCLSGNKNPRRINNLCGRLNAINNITPIRNLEELNYIMENIIGIVDGIDPLCKKYLDTLTRLDTSSLETLSRVSGISKTTIQREIEPILLYKKLISISSKGRSINVNI